MTDPIRYSRSPQLPLGSPDHRNFWGGVEGVGNSGIIDEPGKARDLFSVN